MTAACSWSPSAATGSPKPSGTARTSSRPTCPCRRRAPSAACTTRNDMLAARAHHRLGDGEIVLAVLDFGIDRQSKLVLLHGFRRTLGGGVDLAPEDVGDGKFRVELFGG